MPAAAAAPPSAVSPARRKDAPLPLPRTPSTAHLAVTELEALAYRWKLEGIPARVISQAHRRRAPSNEASSKGQVENPALPASAKLRLRAHRAEARQRRRSARTAVLGTLALLVWSVVCDLLGRERCWLGCSCLRGFVDALRTSVIGPGGLLFWGLGVLGLWLLGASVHGRAWPGILWGAPAPGAGAGGCPMGYGVKAAGGIGDRAARGTAAPSTEAKAAGPGAVAEAGIGEVEEARPWREKRDAIWRFLQDGAVQGSQVNWPATADVGAEVFNGDYTTLLHDTSDKRSGNQKLLCHAGAVALMKMEFFGGHAFTGLFGQAAALEGLVRLSSALGPVSGLPAFSGQISRAKVFPCAALKVFRDGAPSGNLLFGGSKTGQAETNFFAHCQCSHMTEKVGFLLQPILSRFRQYSNYPTQLGLSEFASRGQDGAEASEPVFPWCLVLRPSAEVEGIAAGVDARFGSEVTTDTKTNFIEQILAIPAETPLFDIFAVPDPTAALDQSSRRSLLRIGRMTTTTPFLHSSREPELFFKHQRKEEDYDLVPEWFSQIRPEHQLYGSKEFEKRINRDDFHDLEGPAR